MRPRIIWFVYEHKRSLYYLHTSTQSHQRMMYDKRKRSFRTFKPDRVSIYSNFIFFIYLTDTYMQTLELYREHNVHTYLQHHIDNLYLYIRGQLCTWAGCILIMGRVDGCGYDSQQNTLFVTIIGRTTWFKAQWGQFFAKLDRFVVLMSC